MADATPFSLAGRSILVVEDDALVGMGLVEYLNDLGAAVTWSPNVEEAMTSINRIDRIDAAIVDLNLDGCMSTPVIDRLLEQQVFTILCTGYDVSTIEKRFRDLPCSQKPFTRGRISGLLANGI